MALSGGLPRSFGKVGPRIGGEGQPSAKGIRLESKQPPRHQEDTNTYAPGPFWIDLQQQARSLICASFGRLHRGMREKRVLQAADIQADIQPLHKPHCNAGQWSTWGTLDTHNPWSAPHVHADTHTNKATHKQTPTLQQNPKREVAQTGGENPTKGHKHPTHTRNH